MQQWEYMYLRIRSRGKNFTDTAFEVIEVNFANLPKPRPEFMEYINELGRDGWELVNWQGNFNFIFKRPLSFEG